VTERHEEDSGTVVVVTLDAVITRWSVQGIALSTLSVLQALNRTPLPVHTVYNYVCVI
jgi:hypothetical protein